MSLVNTEFIKKSILEGIREDGRKLDEYRDIQIEINKIPQANGSARVKIGNTEVIAGVKYSVGTPYPDTANQGMFMVNMELSPMSSKEFRAGPPSPEAIEISRVVDRVIRESKTVDFEKLCIKEGEAAWMLSVDIYPINAEGNLFDAAVIAALLAIKNSKFPEYDEKTGKVNHEVRTKNGVKLQNLPAMVTVVKIGDQLVIDPTNKEEQIMDARLHIATIDNGNICAMQKGGVTHLSYDELKNAIKLASDKGKDLRKLLKKY